jgi:DNA polymerase-3 subunit beta
MRVEVKSLSRVLNKVSVCSSKRAHLEICQTVHIQNDADKLNLTCSNIHSYYKRNLSVIPSNANENINVCVNVDSLKKALSSLSGYCDISTKENRVLIQSLSEKDKGSYFELSCQNGEDFPNPSDNKDFNTSFAIRNDILKTLLESTYFASSDDELKLKMCGIYFEVSESTLKCNATNGYILSHNVIDNEEYFSIKSENKEFNFFIDIKSIKHLLSVVKDSKGITEVLIGEKFVHFNFDIGTFSCFLNTQKFPDYQFLLDGESMCIYHLRLNRNDFIDGIKKVIGFSDKKTRKIKFSFKESQLNLYAENESNNHFSSFDLPFENITANEEHHKAIKELGFKIGFNGEYMLNCLAGLNSEYVVLSIISQDKVCFLSPCLQENKRTENVRQKMAICPMLLKDS